MTKYLINASNDDIWYIPDEFDTRDEAMAEGVRQYKDFVNDKTTDLFGDYKSDIVPSVFYIGEKHLWSPEIDTGFILEQLEEDAYLNCGESAGDYIGWLSCDAYRSLDKKLQDALKSWFDEQGVEFYSVINIEEIDISDCL